MSYLNYSIHTSKIIQHDLQMTSLNTLENGDCVQQAGNRRKRLKTESPTCPIRDPHLLFFCWGGGGGLGNDLKRLVTVCPDEHDPGKFSHEYITCKNNLKKAQS